MEIVISILLFFGISACTLQESNSYNKQEQNLQKNLKDYHTNLKKYHSLIRKYDRQSNIKKFTKED